MQKGSQNTSNKQVLAGHLEMIYQQTTSFKTAQNISK